MNANTRSFWKTFLFSAAGLAAMAALIVVVNAVSRSIGLRADFTDGRIFTLSDGTRAVLAKMDAPVTIRLYRSRDPAQMPASLRGLADRVEGLLREYRRFSDGRITLRVLDPQPATDDEDSAALDGVTPYPLPNGESMYLGLAVSCLDKTVPVPFVSPDREPALEYDVTRAVCRVLRPGKPVVAVASSLPVLGGAGASGDDPGAPPWAIISELGKDFTVEKANLDAPIPDKVAVLLLLHPSPLSPKAQFNLDQFLLRGGRIAAFLDPVSWVSAMDPLAQAMARVNGTQPGPSTLAAPLFAAWGLRFDPEKVVADLKTMTQLTDAQGRPAIQPAVLSLKQDNRNAADPLTARLGTFVLPFAGCFEGAGAPGLRMTTLLFSSGSSALEPSQKALMRGDLFLRGFTPDGKPKALAVRLEGKFKSAFPAGIPASKETGVAAAIPPGLRESARESAVVLVGDADMLYDRSCVRTFKNAIGKTTVVPMTDNMAFLQNVVEYLAGDENLVRIRSRSVKQRPFTVVEEMLAEAGRQYRDRMAGLEKELSSVQQKLAEQQRQKTAGPAVILSAEQKQSIEEFRKAQADTRLKLRQMQKDLRRDIDRLEFRLKMFNIVLLPALVALAGLAVWLVRKWRRV